VNDRWQNPKSLASFKLKQGTKGTELLAIPLKETQGLRLVDLEKVVNYNNNNNNNNNKGKCKGEVPVIN
jgi:hypothetical protein